MLKTELRVSDESLADIRDEWLSLIADSAIRTVFVRPIWHEVWLRSFQGDRTSRIYTVRDGERLLGVAPFLAVEGALSFSGDPNNCDYMDFIIRIGFEEPVLQALLGAIASDGHPDLQLWGVVESSPTIGLLPEVAKGAGYTLAWEEEAVCPRLELPATWDDYLAGLSKKNRHELRRKMRRFYESGGVVTFYALTAPEDVGPAMDEFHHLMESSKLEKAEFMTPQMEAFFREMTVTLAGQGLIRLYFLEIDGVRKAAVLCFDCENELLMYNSGYDPTLGHIAVGLISKALLVKDAIEQGRRAVDFLRGHERYKYDLGAQNAQVYRCTVTKQ